MPSKAVWSRGGALVGVTVGAITNNSKSRSAAAGAAAGGLMGGMKRRDQVIQQNQAEQQWAQREANNYAQQRNQYNRAYSACLEGKGCRRREEYLYRVAGQALLVADSHVSQVACRQAG